jgi:glutamyl-tRNA synthetase/nondiscriminating glutamyl-tRNA synthetase
LHVGNVRTALFNWFFARRLGGVFILRLEDTDLERSTEESVQNILHDLRWLGLDWDEGPDIGGPYGPYRQTERLSLYAEAARRLLDSGRAYYCFCTPGMLDAERQVALAAGRAPKYSGRCRSLSATEASDRVSAGEAAAIRFAVQREGAVTFRDLVRGEIAVQSDVIGDPVLVRSGGVPAYNFAVVIDDVAMKVTHVVRGEDHISNTPRQLLIYEALDAPAPAFAHLSMVLGPDHAPLSKRHGATSVMEFRAQGYLPEALVNYLALLGWSPGDNEEIVPLAEMARRFSLDDVSHSAAVFDINKLAWLDRHYIKVADPPRIARESARYFVNAGFITEMTGDALQYIERLLPMCAGSVDRLQEIPERCAFLFRWDAGRAAALVRDEPDGVRAVGAFADDIREKGPLDRDTFRGAAGRVREATGLKGKQLFHPIRVALTGESSGPELDLAVPAIEAGAALGPASGVMPVLSCRERMLAVLERLDASQC